MGQMDVQRHRRFNAGQGMESSHDQLLYIPNDVTNTGAAVLCRIMDRTGIMALR